MKDAYQNSNQSFQKYFIALSVFSLFFFAAILLPYLTATNDRYRLEQENKTKTDRIGALQELIDVYQNAQSKSRTLTGDMNTASANIKNVSLSKPEEREFNNRPIKISDTTGASENPQIASFGENVYLVWKDRTSNYEQIAFSNTSRNSVLANTTQVIGHPEVAVSGDNVYVVWSNSTNGKGDIYLRKSIDGGRSFVNFTGNLSRNAGNSEDIQIAVSGPNVYIVWTDDTEGNPDVYFRQSTNNGSNFGNIKHLSSGRGVSIDPQITTFGNNVYVAWIERIAPNLENVMFTRSIDNGTKFADRPKHLNKDLNAGDSLGLKIVVLEDNVHIVWSRLVINGVDNVYHMSSKNNGTTFSKAAVISRGINSFKPDIALSGNNAYVAWEGRQPASSSSDIYFKRSIDNGSSFNETKALSSSGGTSKNPQIASFGENVYIVWEDNVEGRQINLTGIREESNRYLTTSNILFKSSLSNGDTFLETIPISNNNGSSFSPQMSVSANNIYVTWTNDISGNKEIYLNLDKSGLQAKVLDRFSTYRNILRETIFVPFKGINEKVSSVDAKKSLQLSEEILDKIKRDTMAILNKVKRLDSDLLTLSVNIIEKSGDARSLLNISQPEDSERTALEVSVPRTSETKKVSGDILLEDDIQERITTIEDDAGKLANSLLDEQKALSKSLQLDIQGLKEVKVKLEGISKRLEAIETPLGAIPVELKDSILVFPTLVAIGLFICLHLLNEAICLRKSLQILYQIKYNKYNGEFLEQTALVVPLWIDPFDSTPKRMIWFIVLLIPFLVYLVSFFLILSNTIHTGNFLNYGIQYGYIFYAIYGGFLAVLVYLYGKILYETQKYKNDIPRYIKRYFKWGSLPNCGKKFKH